MEVFVETQIWHGGIPPTPVVNIPLGNDRIMKSVNIKKYSGDFVWLLSGRT